MLGDGPRASAPPLRRPLRLLLGRKGCLVARPLGYESGVRRVRRPPARPARLQVPRPGVGIAVPL